MLGSLGYALRSVCSPDEYEDTLLRPMIEAYDRERFELAFEATTGAKVVVAKVGK